MNSYLTLLALALGVATYTGCSGDDTDTGDDDDDDDDDTTTDDETTPTGDTAPEGPEWLEITSIYMYGGWGFDGANIVDMTLPEDSGGGTMPNAITLTFATDFWSGYYDDLEEYCQVVIPLTNATLAEWAQEDDRLLYGIDWNPDDTAITDCHDDTNHLPVNPDDWGTDMAADWTDGVEWGAAIGDWSDELQEAGEDLTGGTTTEELQDEGLLGGRLLIDDAFAGGPELEDVYAHGYKADVKRVVAVLNEVLATELVCVLRYKRHYFTASGIHAQAVAAEFLQHANEEQGHADSVAARIVQLDGSPNFNPEGLATRSHSQYDEKASLVEMIREDLIAERIAIETYSEIVRWLGTDDPTTRQLIESILKVEEEHADDLKTLLETQTPRKKK